MHKDAIAKEICVLKQHIQHAAKQLEQQDSSPESDGLGSLIYLGNHQDAIPRNLILDPHLESGEIHTWTLLKIHIINPALPSSIPTQNDLMEILKCSRPVLSRHLQVLRALRWITLCAEVRGHDGQYRGNVYAQHDQPLSLQDTLYLDPGYIQFLEQSSSGPTLKRLRQIKDAVLRHLDYQVDHGVQLDKPPSHIDQLSTQLKRLGPSHSMDTLLACPVGATAPNEVANLYTKQAVSSESAQTHRQKRGKPAHVNNIYMDRVNVYMDECSSSSNITTTTNTTTKLHRLNFPKVFDSERLRNYACKIVSDLNEDQQQFALDYLADRIRAGEQGTDKPVGNTIGFLNWIVRHIKADTLPLSTYGVRVHKDKKKNKTCELDEQKDRKKEHQQWIASMRRQGYEFDENGRAFKPKGERRIARSS